MPAVRGILKGWDPLVNLVLDETIEELRGTFAVGAGGLLVGRGGEGYGRYCLAGGGGAPPSGAWVPVVPPWQPRGRGGAAAAVGTWTSP